MQINNQGTFMGNVALGGKRVPEQMSHMDNGKRKQVFAGDLNHVTDPVAERKKAAQKKAMKVVSDAFNNEVKVCEDLKSRRDRIGQMEDTVKNVQAQLDEIENRRTKLREIYGVSEGSDEETLDPDYKSRMKELDDFADDLGKQLDKAKATIKSEVATIQAVSIERLKSHAMADARMEEKEILDAASDEALGMLFEEGREHVDERLEENIEKAEKQAEEKKQEKEKIEEIREKADEMQQFSDRVREETGETSAPMDDIIYNMVELGYTKTDVQKELENIVDKMKLLMEDIKGSQVDSEI